MPSASHCSGCCRETCRAHDDVHAQVIVLRCARLRICYQPCTQGKPHDTYGWSAQAGHGLSGCVHHLRVSIRPHLQCCPSIAVQAVHQGSSFKQKLQLRQPAQPCSAVQGAPLCQDVVCALHQDFCERAVLCLEQLLWSMPTLRQPSID